MSCLRCSARFAVVLLGRGLMAAWPIQHAKEQLAVMMATIVAPYQLVSLALSANTNEILQFIAVDWLLCLAQVRLP